MAPADRAVTGFSFDGGHVLSVRGVWEDPVFRSEMEIAAFHWMLRTAQWRDATVQTRRGPIGLKAGEVLISERSLAARCGLHRNTLRSLLNRLVSKGCITLIRDHSKDQLITVCRIENYKLFQSSAVGNLVDENVSRTSEGTSAGPVQDQEQRIKESERKESRPTDDDMSPASALLASAEIVSLQPRTDDVRIAMERWNGFATDHSLPQVDTNPKLRAYQKRRGQMQRTLAEVGGLTGFEAALKVVAGNDFLLGRTSDGRGWRCNLDFLLRPMTMDRLLHGYYDQRPAGKKASDDAFAELDLVFQSNLKARAEPV